MASLLVLLVHLHQELVALAAFLASKCAGTGHARLPGIVLVVFMERVGLVVTVGVRRVRLWIRVASAIRLLHFLPPAVALLLAPVAAATCARERPTVKRVKLALVDVGAL